MEMKTKILDKKHLLIIVISIFSIIISYFNVTYAFFEDSKNQPISIKSVNTFGESTVYEPNVFIEGNLSYTNKIKNNQTLSFTKDNVDTHDYLLTVATQVEPHTTEYEDNEYTSISYEIYHKTQEDLDTSSFTCTEGKYNNGTSEDACNTGTFIENSLNGLPFELLKDYKITDTNTHYFDVYIYLNNETTSKMFKTRIFYLDKEVEKEKVDINYYTDPLLEGNDPDIENSGLVPVRYLEDENGNWNWTIINPEEKWYDYEKQEWANAVSLAPGVSKQVGTKLKVPDGTSTDSDILAMFVWIPRYSYTIGCTSESSCYGYRMNDDSDKNLGTPSSTLPGAIDIKFVSKDTSEDPGIANGTYPTYTYTSETDRNPTNYYTHPAFNFGNDKLTGIWVGKFETSVDSTSTCYKSMSKDNCNNTDQTPRILPNVISLRFQTVSNQFNTANKFSASENIYGIDNTKTDGHMMKNSEWGAVAYLSQSIYGKYGNYLYGGIYKSDILSSATYKEIYKNNSGNFITGMSAGIAVLQYGGTESNCRYDDITDRYDGKGSCGAGASTTGNIYGIYDMSGGAYEYVMGYYTEASSVFGSTSSSNYSEFTNETKPDEKYFDGYKGIISGDTKTIDLFTKAPEVIGHATAETKNWYSDNAFSISASGPWVERGGYFVDSSSAGAFSSSISIGYANNNNSFRSVLATIE